MSTLISQLIAEIQALGTAPEDVFWQKEAEQYLRDGKIVSAVKVIRASKGWSLMECKKHADFYQTHRYWDIEASLREIIAHKSSTITQLRDELAKLEDRLAALEDWNYLTITNNP